MNVVLAEILTQFCVKTVNIGGFGLERTDTRHMNLCLSDWVLIPEILKRHEFVKKSGG